MIDKTDYIKREDAIKACELQMLIAEDGSTLGGYYPRADDIAEKIKDIPSADVVPRTTDGEFIRKEDAINALAISQGFGGINADELNKKLNAIPSADVVERKTYEHKWHELSMKELELEKENHELRVQLESFGQISTTDPKDIKPTEYTMYGDVERKRGEWSIREWAEELENRLIPNYVCSVCNSWEREKSDFCPNCGADMRGTE